MFDPWVILLSKKVRENFYFWVLLGTTGYYWGTMGILLGTTGVLLGYYWGTTGAVLRQYWCSTKGSIGALLGQY